MGTEAHCGLRAFDRRCSSRRSSADGSAFERPRTGNFSRMSMRDEHDYLGIPGDDDEAQAPSVKSPRQKSSFFDRFRGSSIVAPTRIENLQTKRGSQFFKHVSQSPAQTPDFACRSVVRIPV